MLCVWPRGVVVETKSVWETLRSCLPNELLHAILKVKRVAQKNNNIRYDIQINDMDATTQIFWVLQKCQRSLQWYVKRHVPYIIRARRKTQGSPLSCSNSVESSAQLNSKTTRSSINIASLNVMGIHCKKEEVMYMCRSEKIDILLLQETLFKDNGWKLSIPGYSVASTPMVNGIAGQRGLAVAVRKDLLVMDEESDSPYVHLVRVQIGKSSCIIGSVYIPCSGYQSLRREAWKSVKNAVLRVQRRLPEAVIILGGDWNSSPKLTKSQIARWNAGLVLREVSGSGISFRRGRKSSLDFFAVSASHLPFISKSRVNRTWDISDHWPIFLRIQVQSLANVKAQRAGFRMKKEISFHDNILLRDHNQWSALASLIEEEANAEAESQNECEVLSRHADLFVESAQQIVRDIGLANDQPKKHKRWFGLSKRSKKLIDERRKLGQEISDEKFETLPLEEQYLLADNYAISKRESRQCIALDKQRAWNRHVEQGAGYLRDNKHKMFWQWVRKTNGRASNMVNVTQPIRSSVTGDLLLDPADILNAWAQHYAHLFRDESGHSQDRAYWQQMDKPEVLPRIHGLNKSFTWFEVNRVLFDLQNGKAPGASGLTGEVLKAACENNWATVGEVPVHDLGKVILSLARRMFDNACIPKVLKTAEIVNIGKKGDLTLMDNYRGIALLEVLRKVVSTVVIRRISNALESTGRLIRNQGGFRPSEECMGHVAALYEICRRRQIAHKKTIVIFVDIRKAYDTVPHGALLEKVHRIGIRGKILRFIEAAYADAEMSIRLPCGTSEAVRQFRGLLQGCPMSPTLFDIFDNDILSDMEGYGVRVPGLEASGNDIVSGLLWADDTTLLAGSIEEAKTMLEILQQWGERWEMKFSPKKCGCMVIGGSMKKLRSAKLSLAGTPLPVVDEYVYLGVPFNRDLNLTSVANARANAAMNAVMATRGLISNKSIPLAMRTLIVKQSILPIAMYGGELLGCNEQLANIIGKPITAAMRLLMGMTIRSRRTSKVALALELDMPMISASLTAKRVRAWKKYPALKTTISQLLMYPLRSERKWTWVTGTENWLKRYAPDVLVGGADFWTPSQWAQSVLRYLREKAINKGRIDCVSVRWHEEYKFQKTSKYVKLAIHMPAISSGIVSLAQMRSGAFLTSRRLSQMGLLPARYLRACPCCEVDEPETIEHILLECKAWSVARAELLRICRVHRLVDCFLLDLPEQAILLLGGEVRGVHYRTQFLYGSSQSQQPSERPLYMAVGAYLQTIHKQRLSCVWSKSTLSQRSDEYGSPG